MKQVNLDLVIVLAVNFVLWFIIIDITLSEEITKQQPKYEMFVGIEGFRKHIDKPRGFYNEQSDFRFVRIKNNKNTGLLYGYGKNSFSSETHILFITKEFNFHKNLKLDFGIGGTYGYRPIEYVVYNGDLYIVKVPLINDKGYGVGGYIGVGYKISKNAKINLNFFGNCAIITLESKIIDI